VQSAVRQVSVTAVNDAPVMGNNTLTLTQGSAVVLGAGQLSASDVDSAAAGLVFSVTGVSHGRFELVSNPGVAITSFTQGQIASGQIRFVHDGSASAPAYSVSVSDGSLTVGPYLARGNLVVPAVPAAPALPVAPAPNLPAPVVQPATASSAGAGAPAVARPAVVFPGAGIAAPEVVLNVETLKLDIKGLVREAVKLTPTPNHYEPGGPIQVGLELPSGQAQLSFGPLTPPEWTAQFAFPDEGGSGGQKDQIKILLEQVQLGGLALSVGVVWWASRVSGLLGSLLASAPAWRNIDPLPVLGRDEEQDKDKGWFEGEDLERDADELAMSLMLDSHERTQAD
jgi:hypothetical protein